MHRKLIFPISFLTLTFFNAYGNTAPRVNNLPIRQYSSPSNAGYGILSPDKTMVLGRSEQDIVIWDKESAEIIRRFEIEGAEGQFSPDSKKALIYSRYQGLHSLTLWNIASGAKYVNFQYYQTTNLNHFSPTGESIIVLYGKYYDTSPPNVAALWSFQNHQTVKLFPWPGEVYSYAHLAYAFSKSGKYLVASEVDSFDFANPTNIVLYDAVNGSEIRTLPPSGHLYQKALDISDDETRILAGNTEGFCRIWELETGNLINELQVIDEGEISVVKFSPAGEFYAVGTHQGYVANPPVPAVVKIVDVNRNEIIQTLNHDEPYPIDLQFTTNGDRLLIVSRFTHNAAKLWDFNSGKLIANLTYYYNVELTPDENRIIGGRLISRPTLWDAHTGHELMLFEPGNFPGGFTADGMQVLITNATDNYLFDISSGNPDLVGYLLGSTSNSVGLDFNFDASIDIGDAVAFVGGKQFFIGNINQPDYKIAQFNSFKLVYSDRNYRYWYDVPAFLLDQPYLVTRYEDRNQTGDNFLNFEINRPVTIYLVVDPRLNPLPAWMQDWTPTEHHIDTSDDNRARDIYMKTFQAGPIILGGNWEIGLPEDVSMYSLIVIPD